MQVGYGLIFSPGDCQSFTARSLRGPSAQDHTGCEQLGDGAPAQDWLREHGRDSPTHTGPSLAFSGPLSP